MHDFEHCSHHILTSRTRVKKMGMQGDFYQLLKEQGYTFGVPTTVETGHALRMPRRFWLLSIETVCWWPVIVARPPAIW